MARLDPAFNKRLQRFLSEKGQRTLDAFLDQAFPEGAAESGMPAREIGRSARALLAGLDSIGKTDGEIPFNGWTYRDRNDAFEGRRGICARMINLLNYYLENAALTGQELIPAVETAMPAFAQLQNLMGSRLCEPLEDGKLPKLRLTRESAERIRAFFEKRGGELSALTSHLFGAEESAFLKEFERCILEKFPSPEERFYFFKNAFGRDCTIHFQQIAGDPRYAALFPKSGGVLSVPMAAALDCASRGYQLHTLMMSMNMNGERQDFSQPIVMPFLRNPVEEPLENIFRNRKDSAYLFRKLLELYAEHTPDGVHTPCRELILRSLPMVRELEELAGQLELTRPRGRGGSEPEARQAR